MIEITFNLLGSIYIGKETINVSKILRILLITLATLILIIGVGGYYSYQYVLQELEPTEGDQLVDIHIPKGSTIKQAAAILEEQNLLRNGDIFFYYIRWQHPDVQFMAGDYRLAQGTTIEELIETLSAGNVIRETVRFTIPEGYTVEQMAAKLTDEGLVDRQKFLEAANDRNYDFWFIAEIPDDTVAPYALEGFLFPETYEVLKGSSEREIVERMLRQFDFEFKQDWRLLSEQLGLSIYEVVTMASIVEREAIVDKERPAIAGVFYNRLFSSPAWKLESCATIQYALGKQKSVITFADLEVDSLYNTYKHEGLPPAPIANPGRESLKASVIPDEHNFYFFVTKKDGTNEHHFSRTYQEHLQNDAQSRGSW